MTIVMNFHAIVYMLSLYEQFVKLNNESSEENLLLMFNSCSNHNKR